MHLIANPSALLDTWVLVVVLHLMSSIHSAGSLSPCDIVSDIVNDVMCMHSCWKSYAYFPELSMQNALTINAYISVFINLNIHGEALN